MTFLANEACLEVPNKFICMEEALPNTTTETLETYIYLKTFSCNLHLFCYAFLHNFTILHP